jgi:hypothetical protein
MICLQLLQSNKVEYKSWVVNYELQKRQEELHFYGTNPSHQMVCFFQNTTHAAHFMQLMEPLVKTIYYVQYLVKLMNLPIRDRSWHILIKLNTMGNLALGKSNANSPFLPGTLLFFFNLRVLINLLLLFLANRWSSDIWNGRCVPFLSIIWANECSTWLFFFPWWTMAKLAA